MKFQKFIVAATLLLLASLIAWNSGFAQPPEAESKGKKIASVLQPYVEKQQLAGAVILVSGPEKTLCVESVGLADVATQKPLKSDAVFWIASMTKPITATALMMLVDEGKVKLDDPVAKHLPEFAGQMYVADRRDGEVVLRRPKQPVLVKNLLTHTSGMMGDSPVEPTHGCVPLKAAVAAYSLGPTTFAPGLEFEYNNPGINIAGRIIEVASGMPYEKFMQERLFDPLGMQDTTFFPNAAQL
ncbi:MAG TPA: serine hydrolase domain-containing protein, partial [Pirellulales bacterium]